MAIIREVDWLELPDHLTSFVTDKLSRCDFIRFGAVCKSWFSVYAKHPRHSLPHQIPLLLLRDDGDDPSIHNFYDLGEKRLSRLQVSVRRTGALRAGTSRGCSHGWLPIVWRQSSQLKVCLTNPFLSEDKNIKLPYVNQKYCRTDNCLINVVLSADPTLEPNFLVMLIIDYGRLAFLKPASDNTDWTYLDTQSESIEDAIYYRDQFYFVDSSGALFVCELNDLHDPPKAVLVAPSPCSTIEHEYDYNKVFHLVELLLSGELLLTKKLRKYTKNEIFFYTVGFSTYKMNPLVELKWMEVHNLCGDTVYLDKYSSVSLMVSEFPECKPNCIYFIEAGYFYVDRSEITVHDDNDDDDTWYRPYYVGVFNLVDGTVMERCCPLENPTVIFLQPPFWIEPKLYRHC